ncbi:MAG TPA: DUF4388 domain-containing protein [Thermoanaerobaculia bacterium]|nr:DUF4388 domain-containing protein [Thermoanaerobaculia bacterium]
MPKTLCGNLDTFSLGDLLQWLEINALSGRVMFTRGDVKRTIDLKRGSIIYVSSSRPDERLGFFLANRSLLPEPVVYELLAENFITGVTLTRLILAKKYLTREKLAHAVESLAVQVLLDLFHWRGSSFEFDPLFQTEDLLNIHLSLRGQVLAFQGAKSIDDSARLRPSLSMADIQAPWVKEFDEEAVTSTFWSVAESAREESMAGGGLRDRFYAFTLFASEVRRKLHEPFVPLPVFDDTAAMLQGVLEEEADPERILQISALDPFLTLDLIYLGNALLIDPRSLISTARQAADVIGGAALALYIRLLAGAETAKAPSVEKMERAVRRAALSTAVAASHISGSHSMDAELAYTLGLLEPLGGYDLLKLLVSVDFPPGSFRASALERYRSLYGRMLAQKLNLPAAHEAVLGSEGRITARSPASEQLIFLAKQMAPSDQIGREWTSEDPELADRYSDLAREPELSGRIANDASMLREILNL